jgi:hypothetical protein
MTDRSKPVQPTVVALQLPYSLGLEPKSCVYLSTPITTGPALIEWKKKLGHQVGEPDREYWIAHQSNVIEENLRRIVPIVIRLRKQLFDIVIDPTALSIPNWSQREYRAFWCDVIRQWCRAVVLSEGWALSTGCCLEAATAVEEGLEVWDQDLNEMDLISVFKSASSARDELVALGMATDDYLDAVEHLLKSPTK